jgi:hypothetical protein
MSYTLKSWYRKCVNNYVSSWSIYCYARSHRNGGVMRKSNDPLEEKAASVALRSKKDLDNR